MSRAVHRIDRQPLARKVEPVLRSRSSWLDRCVPAPLEHHHDSPRCRWLLWGRRSKESLPERGRTELDRTTAGFEASLLRPVGGRRAADPTPSPMAIGCRLPPRHDGECAEPTKRTCVSASWSSCERSRTTNASNPASPAAQYTSPVGSALLSKLRSELRKGAEREQCEIRVSEIAKAVGFGKPICFDRVAARRKGELRAGRRTCGDVTATKAPLQVDRVLNGLRRQSGSPDRARRSRSTGSSTLRVQKRGEPKSECESV